jgi:hypothetical protein
MAAKTVRHFVAAVQAGFFFSEMLCFQSWLADLDALRYWIPGMYGENKQNEVRTAALFFRIIKYKDL